MANISKADLVKELAEQTNMGQKDVKALIDGILISRVLKATVGGAFGPPIQVMRRTSSTKGKSNSGPASIPHFHPWWCRCQAA